MLSPALEAFSICLMQLGELSIWKARQLMHLGAKISLHKRRTRHSGVCKLISFLGLPSDSVKHTLHKLVESKRRHAGGDGEDPRRLDRIELDWIKGCHCLEWLFQVHSIPRPTGTSITISTPWERILSWCYMSWKLFEWMINIYGWVFGGQTKQNRTETKRNKTNSLLLLLGAGKRPSHWYGAYIWHTHTHTKGSPDSTSPCDSRLISPAGSAGSSQSSTSSIQVQIGTETHINPWPPASIEILAPNADATPLSLCKHQHHAHTMLEL